MVPVLREKRPIVGRVGAEWGQSGGRLGAVWFRKPGCFVDDLG